MKLGDRIKGKIKRARARYLHAKHRPGQYDPAQVRALRRKFWNWREKLTWYRAVLARRAAERQAERDAAQAYAGSRYWTNRAAAVSARFGVPVSSRKRARNHPLSISNPSSDHNEANTSADAVDLATFNGSALAHAIAREFGITNYSTGNYNGYTVSRGGHSWRVQILWAVSGHFNHVHVGVRRL